MNLYRLVRARPNLNSIGFTTILQSNIKSSLANKPKIVSNLRGLRTSKHEYPVAVDPYNLAILRLSNSHKAAAESGSLYERRIVQQIEILISQLAEEVDVDAMEELYTKVREQGIELPSTSYQILIKSLAKEGPLRYLESATKICRNCIPKPWFADFFKLNTVMFNTLLGRLYSRFFNDFMELVEMLENQGLPPDIYFYEIMINELVMQWRSQDAMEVFKKQSAKGMKFESDTYNDLFTVLVCGNQKNLDDIKWLYNDAHEKNVEFYHDCFETLIKALSENEDFDAVLQVYDEYKLKKTPNYTLSGLCSNNIRELCKECKVDEAKAVFEWMVSKGMFPSEFALNCLISRYCENDNYVKEVKWTFNKIQEKGLSTDEYCDTDVLKLISRVGDSETAREANQVLMAMKEFCSPIPIEKERKLLNSFLGVCVSEAKEIEYGYPRLPSLCI